MNNRKIILIPMITLISICSAAVLISSIILFNRELNKAARDRIKFAETLIEHEIDKMKAIAYSVATRMAENPDMKNAIILNDREKILHAAYELQNITEVEFCAILDPTGVVLARTHSPSNYGDDLTWQRNVASAMTGEVYTAVEQGSAVLLSVRSGVPVYDDDINIIGIVSIGFRLDSIEFANELKEATQCEISIYLQNDRIATTLLTDEGLFAAEVIQDEQLNAAVLAGDSFFVKNQVSGKEILNLCSPLYSTSDEIIGMLCIGEYTVDDNEKMMKFILNGVLITLGLLAVCIVITMKIANHIEKQMLLKSDEVARKHKETEEAIHSVNNLTNILNRLDAMIYITDPKTNEILLINDIMKQHYGIEGDCIGQKCYTVLQRGRDRRCDSCPYKQLVHEPDKTVVWEEHSNITHHIYRNSDRLIEWPDGRMAHLQHSIDITDLRIATQQLDRRIEQQTLMTKVSQNFLSTVDTDKQIADALHIVGEFMDVAQILLFVGEGEENNYICRHEWINPVLGLPTRFGSAFLISESLMNLLNERKNNDVVCLLSSDATVNQIMKPYRKNFLNYMTLSIFLDDKLYAVLDISRKDEVAWTQNRIDMAVLLSNMLTSVFQRLSVQKQLIAAKELAEQSNQSKSIFLTSMSHEIRTPMNAILGIAEIQLQEKDLKPEMEEALASIYDSGDLLLNIINDILDLSKIEAGKLELMPVKYDIPSLICDTVQLNRMRYESKPLDFTLRLAEDTPLDLYGDELRIKQILNNLLSNAYKYTDAGTIGLSVGVEPGEGEQVMLVLQVSDTGQGMREDQIEKLFDAYTRFNMETNRSVVGTGLGMNITRQLVDMMNGSITVESEVGKGSTFTIRLPQMQMGTKVCGADLAEKMQQFSFQSITKLQKTQVLRAYMPYGSVLVVDDVSSNLYVAKGLMLPYGFAIDTAVSGFDAIEKVEAGKVYDIIFMDQMMPFMDGMETVRILREKGYTYPIVALTANAMAGQSELFMANGFNGFISKPIDSRELNAVINTFIRDRHVKGEPLNHNQKEQEMIKYFLNDAKKAVEVMEASITALKENKDTDAQLYTITAHGIKSGLYNIGEKALSDWAYTLEQAGQEKEVNTILSETPGFLNALRMVIDKYEAKTSVKYIDEHEDYDTPFLQDKLSEIKMACEDFDKKTANKALTQLLNVKWTKNIQEALENMENYLLHGDFDDVVKTTDELIKKVNNK